MIIDRRWPVKRGLFTTEDVSGVLGIAPRTVRQWADAGQLPGFKMGRQWRFRPGQIGEWLRRRSEDQDDGSKR